MTDRRPDVQAFLEAVRAGFSASRTAPETERCVRDVFARLDGAVGRTKVGSTRFPACAMLPRALDAAKAAAPALSRVASAFEALVPSLGWSQRNGGPQASANLMDGHANAMVVGPGGLEDRSDVWVGLSLLAPHVRYPDHHHAPEEAYLLLSPGEFRQGDGAWFEPGPGGTLFNEPGILHAMRSGAAPLLALWCLRPDETP